MVPRALFLWVLLLLLAVTNGAFRQAFLIPQLGDALAHVISTLLLSTLIIVGTWFALPWVRPLSASRAWLVGMIWVLLTIAFEFLAGHYLFGTPWETLLIDYNLAQGRIWVLVLLMTLVSPILVYRFRKPRLQP